MLIDIAVLLIAISNLITVITVSRMREEKPITIPKMRLKKAKVVENEEMTEFEKNLAEWEKSLKEI